MRAILHDVITGEPLRELQVTKLDWSTGVCRPDEVTATIPGYTSDSAGLRNLIVPRKHAISVVRDDWVCIAAGIIGRPRATAADDGTPAIEVPCRGIESVFERRVVLPYPYGPLVDAGGYPDARYDTRIDGVDYGTMMQRLYQQAMAHPGGAFPVAWEAARPGTREKIWAAVDGKGVQDAVEDISQLLGGVEWDWAPCVDELDRLSWALITGTDALQEITSAYWHDWTSGGESPALRGLTESTSPEFMASTAFFTGGKDDDRVLVSRQHDQTLIAAGFPLAEIWDSSHSTVSEQATLDGWAKGALADGQAPVQFWEAEVRADRAAGLRHGDWCTIEVLDHWWIPDGIYERRIVEVSGDAESEWLGITIAGMQGW